MMFVPGPDARMAILDKLKSFYFSDNKDSGLPALQASEHVAKENAVTAVASVHEAVTQEANKAADRAVASLPEYKKSEVGLFLGAEDANSGAINEFLQSGRLDADSESLFKRISSRYRALTPTIVPGYKKAASDLF
jgi:hypothetical protein